MNAQRRKNISEALALISTGRAMIAEAGEAERDYFDCMPESLQSGEKGQRAEEVAEALENLASQMEDLESEIADCTA